MDADASGISNITLRNAELHAKVVRILGEFRAHTKTVRSQRTSASQTAASSSSSSASGEEDDEGSEFASNKTVIDLSNWDMHEEDTPKDIQPFWLRPGDILVPICQSGQNRSQMAYIAF